MIRWAVLMVALAVASAPQEPPAPAQEFDAIVSLRSTMTLSGAATFGVLKVTSDLGTHDVDPTKVRWIEVGERRGQVGMVDSTIQGSIEIGPVQLRTEYGTFKIPSASLSRIHIQGPWKGSAPTGSEPRTPVDLGPTNRLAPSASILLPVPARELFLVSDESALIVHDEASHRLLRFDAATLKQDPHVVEVWKGFRGLREYPDRRYVLGFGTVDGTVPGGRLTVFEDQGRKAAWYVTLDFEPIDVVASPKGRIFILGRNPGPLIAVVDPSTRKVTARWGNMPAGNRLLAGSDGKRLYVVSDEGSSGRVTPVWLSGPRAEDPLKPRPSPIEGRTPVGTPCLMVGQGRYLATGSSVVRIADREEDDLKLAGRFEPSDCFVESATSGALIVSTRRASLVLLSMPDLIVRKAYAPGARLGEMRLDRRGQLFGLTSPAFKPSVEPKPPMVQLVRYDLTTDLAAVAVSRGLPAPAPGESAAIPEVELKDSTGGRVTETIVESSPWNPEIKSGQPCGGCKGTGQVKIDRPEEAGVILRRHQVCLGCSGSGKSDALACPGCLGARALRVMVREETGAWRAVEVCCGRCAGTGWIGRPLSVRAAEAGKPTSCMACAGTGKVRAQRIKDGFGTEATVECLPCGGKGKALRTPCATCGGTGGRPERLTLEVPGTAALKEFPIACPECASLGIRVQAP
jgi:hypothetical protein